MTKQRDGVIRTVKGQPAHPIDPDGFAATFDGYGVTLRPLRARRPEATIYATWSQIYQWALIARTPSIAKGKQRRARVRRKK